MSHAVSTSLETITATNALPALVAKRAALKTKIEEINTHAAIQALPTKGKTKDRNKVFAAAVDATLVVAGLVLSYATASALADLAAKVQLKPAQLNKGRLIRRVQLMQQVYDAAEPLVAKLVDYGVTAATLTDLQTKIAAGDALISSPRTTIMARKVATENLGRAFEELGSLLDHELDPLVLSLREADPAGYALYQAARIVIDRPGTPAKTDDPTGGGGTPVPPDGSGTPAATQPKAA